jgi:hypothetical protein
MKLPIISQIVLHHLVVMLFKLQINQLQNSTLKIRNENKSNIIHIKKFKMHEKPNIHGQYLLLEMMA